ncbi:MAG TPA: S8 family serine peptidase [Sphingomicrobium sp.]|nr:S8 family serine peptidase [Sphingomicrobium sp.]
MPKFVRNLTAAIVAAMLVAGSAGAQLLPGVGLPPLSLPPPVGSVPVAGPVINSVLGGRQAQQVIRPTLDRVSGLPQQIAESGARSLLELRRMRLDALIRDNEAVLEAGDDGEPVRRGMLLAADPDPISLQLALRAGFRLLADERDPVLGLRAVKLAVPRGRSARSALRLLAKVAPRLEADYDHIYEPSGGSLAPLAGSLAAAAGSGNGRIIGMIDGGVASHPSLAKAAIEQNGFSGDARPTGHGTAVASLLVGDQRPFRGAATGAQLYVADIYGGNRAAGSASAIAKALGWLAGKRPQVITVSLVGPANKLVARAIQIVRSRGIQVVAAVGNDGPAAPPQYPASYPGVVSITAVDSNGRAIPEAGRAEHVDFAAPGADMAAALPGQGYAEIRGTSFAAPLAAARLAVAGSPARLAAEARRGKGRVGRGIVCGECPIDPEAVNAK